jgi:hypothetical protein
MDAYLSLPCPPALLDPSPVMGLLHDRLPLTLLLDLALGVRSDEVYASEPADVSWVPARVA